MNEEIINQEIIGLFSQLNEEIVDSLKQIFNNEFAIKHDSDADVNLPDSFEKNPNQVCVYFSTTNQTGEYGHLFSLAPEFATQLYAWMIGDEPTESVTDEHLEGLKEATDQVFGRIKMALAEDPPSIENLTVLQSESVGDINSFIEGKEGATNSFTIDVAENSFPVLYHLIEIQGKRG